MLKRKLRSAGTESIERGKENNNAMEASDLEPQQTVDAQKEEPETLENEKGIVTEYDDLREEDENPSKKVKDEVTGDENVAADVEEDGVDEGDEEEYEDEPLEKLIEPFSKEQLAALVKEAVEKYPDFLERVLRVADADPAHRNIFVYGLGWDTTSETLISAFGKYGVIEDCKAVIDKITGKSKGYAFILFKHRSGAKKALMEPQKKIGVRMISCQLASAGPVPNHGHTHSHAPPPVSIVANIPPVSEYTQRKIFVSNVAADINPGKLLEFFKQFGEVEDGPLGLDKQTSKPKGFALFVYKTAESARKALEEPHKFFEGHKLHCQKAVDGIKNNKFQNQQKQQKQHHQPNYHHKKENHNKYKPRGRAPSYGQGHLMAPTQVVSSFNPSMAAQAAINPALGQALTALIASQGANMGLSNLLGGLSGPPMNQTGTQIMHNGYVNPASLGFGTPQAMQGGYQNPQMGNDGGSSRPPPGLNMGGPPYMGR